MAELDTELDAPLGYGDGYVAPSYPGFIRQGAPRFDALSAEFGLDVSVSPDLDPALTPGVALAEALARRLMTPRGRLHYAPDYGLDIREALLARMDEARLRGWRARIEAEVAKDDRVERVTAALRFDPGAERLAVRVGVQTALGPFALTLAVTAAAVQLLDVG
jgi:hypothetical protein